VYRAFGTRGELIYVGISQNWQSRVLRDHTRRATWWRFVHHIEIAEYPERASAFAAESWVIANQSPPANEEKQVRHRPRELPSPDVAFGQRVHHTKFNGDEIPTEDFDEDQIYQT
jgi:hypothetical protein